jgi:ATP-dependent DNA helicase UvrD/PcrA
VPEELNSEQRRAVDTHAGYIVMMAAPGSGKTTVIDARAKAILATGVRPEKFLSLTFTKEGAKEMLARAGKEFAKSKIFCTFHSWALRFVTAEANNFVALGYNLRHYPLATPYEAAKALGRIVSHHPELRGRKEAFKDAGSFISLCKRRGLSPQKARLEAKQDLEDAYCDVYKKYDEALRTLGAMDFDSIIVETSRLLEKRSDVCARWQYDYLQLDEAQDTDSVQWRIVELINKGNIFAVGDENQGMYSWRGSETNLVERFTARFPGAIVLPLSVNYRSTQEIVKYCKQIAPIQNETVTKLSTPNSMGNAPEFRRYATDWEEAKAIVNSITDLGNTAVLVRTNHQLRAFEDECGERGLKYKLLGKSGFWGRGEVKDVLAFVQYMIAPTDASTVHIIKSPYDCTRYMKKAEIVDNLEAMQARRVDGMGGKLGLHRFLSSYSSMDPNQDNLVRELDRFLNNLRAQVAGRRAGDAVKLIVERTGMLNYYEDDEDSEGIDNNPLENIREVFKVANTKTTLADFLAYTQRVHRASLARKGFLTLSTIHQAKGKEWDTVYVAGVNDGVLPHLKGDDEEEKRIYFVACSRAAQRLHVSGNGVVSKFIKDKLPPEESEGAVETDLWAGWRLGSPTA